MHAAAFAAEDREGGRAGSEITEPPGGARGAAANPAAIFCRLLSRRVRQCSANSTTPAQYLTRFRGSAVISANAASTSSRSPPPSRKFNTGLKAGDAATGWDPAAFRHSASNRESETAAGALARVVLSCLSVSDSDSGAVTSCDKL